MKRPPPELKLQLDREPLPWVACLPSILNAERVDLLPPRLDDGAVTALPWDIQCSFIFMSELGVHAVCSHCVYFHTRPVGCQR